MSEPHLDIGDMDPAELLAELYNRAGAPGLGVLHRTPQDMTVERARCLIAKKTGRFDYVNGRVLKVDIRDGKLWFARLYDRDNGEGAAQACIDAVRERAARP